MPTLTVNEKKILEAILSKKELQSIDKKYAVSELKSFLIRDSIARKYLKLKKVNVRNKEFKRIVSNVRNKLRRAHTMFSIGDRSQDYLRFSSEIGGAQSINKLKKLAKQVLDSHHSSKERYAEYQLFYKFLSVKIPNPNSIVDLGAGLHPFSLIYLNKTKLQGLNYIAIDINTSEKELLELYFSKLSLFFVGFKGRSKILNLTNAKDIKQLTSFKSVDLALMLKLSDHLDQGKGHKQTEKVLKAVPARFVLMSFATVTRSGKRMRYPRRRWVEYLCNRLSYKFESFEISNELFYLIEK